MNVIAQIIAKNPPSIFIALGGIGWLAGVNGAGILLFAGFVLQILWLFFRFR